MKISTGILFWALLASSGGPLAIEGRLGSHSPSSENNSADVGTGVGSGEGFGVGSDGGSTPEKMRALGSMADTSEEGVCHGTVFNPNPNKYYIIGTGGLFWTQGNPQENFYPKPISVSSMYQKITLASSKEKRVDAASHWRFEHTAANGWVIKNRLSGLQVNGLVGLTTADNNLYMGNLDPRCSSNNKKIFFPIGDDHTLFVHCKSGSCKEGSTLDVWFERETKSTECSKSSHCRDGWYQTSERKYGVLNLCSWVECERIKPGVQQPTTEQWWSIEEVTDFTPADIKDVRPPDDIAANERNAFHTYNAELTLAKNLALDVIPSFLFVNALINYGFTKGITAAGADNGPSIEERVNDMKAGLVTMTAHWVSEKVINQAVADAVQKLQSIRGWFLLEYLNKKTSGMKSGHLLDSLLTLLESQTLSFYRETAAFRASTFDPANDLDVQTGQQAFEFLKVALVEHMSMLTEVMLLRAYLREDLSCTEILTFNNIGTKARKHRDDLINTRNMLLQHRLTDYSEPNKDEDALKASYEEFSASWDSRIVDYDYTVTVMDSYTGKKLYEKTPVKEKNMAERLINIQSEEPLKTVAAKQAELNHDMTYFSYPVEDELVHFFDNAASSAYNMCNELRDVNSGFRAKFEEDPRSQA